MRILEHKQNILIIPILLAVFLVPNHTIFAEETYTIGTVMTTATFRWNNENWFTETHPKIASFTILDDGSAYGLTETGIPFRQDNVPNPLSIRVQRFTMQDHYHYIIEGKDVYTFTELSAELARIYNETIANTQA